ncbi:MAG: MBL fold metallo-hydrolase [Candidatus Magasanikbacteria bacterium]|nr:MBL fold metallo-hydrolase [Candidatus Magasanikbacteria bacterium]
MQKNKNLFWVFIIICVLSSTIFLFVSYLEKENEQDKKFRVTFFDVGQGDSSLINFGNDEKMLVDCGPDKTILFKLGRALPMFNKKIDYLLVTHPDLDHYGGCVEVLRRYQVGTIILNGQSKEYNPYWREFNATVEASRARQVVVNGFAKLEIASSTLEFLSPGEDLGLPLADAESNNYSIVFKLTAPSGKTFLFTGDAEEPLEQVLIEKYCSVAKPPPTPPLLRRGEPSVTTPTIPLPLAKGRARVGSSAGCPTLKSDILKVGHHGSNSSSGEDFLSKVNPRTAIISSGQKNKFGHPSPRVIKHLERAGANILRTDILGDIDIIL